MSFENSCLVLIGAVLLMLALGYWILLKRE
jgi:LPXTG-motif cell wall-anchored protein